MTKDKRIGMSLLEFCLHVTVIENSLYLISKVFLDFNPYWLLPLLVFIWVISVVSYVRIPNSILGRFIRKEPLVFDRSGEVPYEFDNPYMSKKSKDEN